MSQLFFFILRDARESSIARYTGLLPKLSPKLSDQQTYIDADEQLDSVIGKDYQGIISDKDQKEYFRKMLESPNNSLKKSRYLLKRDIDKIIQLNLELFDQSSMTKGEYKLFLEHLYMAHSDMEYGIYMGARKSNSEKEFLESVDRAHLTDKNQTLVFYINAENLIDYVDKVKDKYQLQSPLIYFNMAWQYGIIKEGSKRYFGDNFYDFMCYLRGFTNEELLFSETIVQIPLPVDIFKHTFQKEGETFLTGGKKKKTKKQKKTLKKKKKCKKKKKQKEEKLKLEKKRLISLVRIQMN